MYHRIALLLLLAALPACDTPATDQNEHGGAAIPDSVGIADDTLPDPEVPAVLEQQPAT